THTRATANCARSFRTTDSRAMLHTSLPVPFPQGRSNPPGAFGRILAVPPPAGFSLSPSEGERVGVRDSICSFLVVPSSCARGIRQLWPRSFLVNLGNVGHSNRESYTVLWPQ